MFHWMVISLMLFCNTLATETEYQCPDEYTLNEMDNTCIKVHEQPRMRYYDALEICKKEVTGYLVQPESIASNMFIAGLLTKRNRYWMGIRKNEYYGLTYVNGSLLSFNAPWAWGEPNNHRENERCVEIINGRGEWNDKRCSKKRPFVCQTKTQVVDSGLTEQQKRVYDLISCDFEKKCDYTSSTSPEVVTDFFNIVDHTSRSLGGNFLVSRSDLVIKRPLINVTRESCLSFAFVGMGAEISLEYLKKHPSESPIELKSFWREDSFQTWKEISVDVQPLQNAYFLLAAYHGPQFPYGMMDDIKFQPHGCPTT